MPGLLTETSPPSPLVLLEDPLFSNSGIRVFVKRDDLLDPLVSGNKWRKLKYNLRAVMHLPKPAVISFGGAYSNHLIALAAACRELGIECTGIVRGEQPVPLNATLRQCEAFGMKLRYLSRSAYRQRNDPQYLSEFMEACNAAMVIPEGGSSVLALPGVAEMVPETILQLGFEPDCWVVACGTGGTLAGLLAGLGGRSGVIGISVLKGYSQESFIHNLLAAGDYPPLTNFRIYGDYHLGGYARYDSGLMRFIEDFYHKQGILLDPVYTGKMMYALYDLAGKKLIASGSTVVALHTGGLQGWEGFAERWGVRIPGGFKTN